MKITKILLDSTWHSGTPQRARGDGGGPACCMHAGGTSPNGSAQLLQDPFKDPLDPFMDAGRRTASANGDATQASGETCASSRRSRSWSSSSAGSPAATAPWGYSERTRSPARSCSRARSSVASLATSAVRPSCCAPTRRRGRIDLDLRSMGTREALAQVRGAPSIGSRRRGARRPVGWGSQRIELRGGSDDAGTARRSGVERVGERLGAAGGRSALSARSPSLVGVTAGRPAGRAGGTARRNHSCTGLALAATGGGCALHAEEA